jgi:hypothetical protein
MKTKQSTSSPICLSPGEIRQILNGLKTQIRLPLDPQPVTFDQGGHEYCSVAIHGATHSGSAGYLLNHVKSKFDNPYFAEERDTELWIQEPWIALQRRTLQNPSVDISAADGAVANDVLLGYEATSMVNAPTLMDGTYWDGEWNRPSSMPRWASRLTLFMTDARIERLQNIQDDEAIREGAPYFGQGGIAARASFALRWNESCASAVQWSANPFVWVLSFVPLLRGRPIG